MNEPLRWRNPPAVFVVTGTRRAEAYIPRIERELERHTLRWAVPDASVFITGGQVGVDYVALRWLLHHYPGAHHSVWAPAKPHADVRALLKELWPHLRQHGGSYQLHNCLPGTTYPYRDQCMLQEAYDYWHLGSAAHVLAWPLHPEDDGRSRYSGTWKTVRLARAAKLPVQVHRLWVPEGQA